MHVSTKAGPPLGAWGLCCTVASLTSFVDLMDAVQVEREVEHDERIRRFYKHVAGKHNVACWKWVGPTGMSFETVGVSHGTAVPFVL